VLVGSVRLPASRYPGDKELRGFTEESLRRLRAAPGVAAAGATDSVPMAGDHSDSVILAEGYQMKPGESVISPTRLQVAPGFFEAMRIPLVHGRYLEERDSADAPRVVIVDTRLAKRFWPGQNPVGRRMYQPQSAKDALGTSDQTHFLTVIGVVGEVKQDGLVASRTPVGAYYLAMAQETSRYMAFTVRSAGDPRGLAAPLRAAINALDPELPVFSVRTMEQVTDESLVTRRWPMLLSMGFGVVALLLSALGIYGVLAYLVTQRTKEIGIRMAIGGTPRTIFELVLKEGVVLLGAGLVVGGVGLFWLSRALSSQLYGVRASDPTVIALAGLALGAIALVACVIPARRATRINPVVALNNE
jgi:putative ABC transport system permease protein